MFNVKEPMVTNQVHTTTDYFLFKPMEGNRKKNNLHIARLKKSMAENYLFTVLIVNENYEIIDGQHRFEVIKELKLPLNYVVCKGYGLDEVHILNQNSKNWKSEDFLDAYYDLGYPDYVAFKNFMQHFGLSFSVTATIFNDKFSNCNDDNLKSFQRGLFKVNDLNKANDIGNKILILEKLYDGAKRRNFVYAILRLLKNPKFEFTEFLHKLKNQQASMIHCNDVDQYISLIEEIYNYRRNPKISLKY